MVGWYLMAWYSYQVSRKSVIWIDVYWAVSNSRPCRYNKPMCTYKIMNIKWYSNNVEKTFKCLNMAKFWLYMQLLMQTCAWEVWNKPEWYVGHDMNCRCGHVEQMLLVTKTAFKRKTKPKTCRPGKFVDKHLSYTKILKIWMTGWQNLDVVRNGGMGRHAEGTAMDMVHLALGNFSFAPRSPGPHRPFNMPESDMSAVF